MTCPRCGGRTRPRTIKSLKIDRCPACGGAWYDAAELRLLKDRERAGNYRWIDVDLWRERERFRAGKQEHLVCPKDKRELTTVRYGTSRVRVDICTHCRGIWLDTSEYEKILKHLEKQVNTETVQEYLDDLREEFIEIFSGPESFRSEIGDFLKVLHLLELRFIVQHPNVAAGLQRAARGVPGA
jgi:Zn-finger nucleic acid-binding protein